MRSTQNFSCQYICIFDHWYNQILNTNRNTTIQVVWDYKGFVVSNQKLKFKTGRVKKLTYKKGPKI